MADKTVEELRAEIKAELEADHQKHIANLRNEAGGNRKELDAALTRIKEFEDKETERQRIADEAKGEFEKVKKSLTDENASLKGQLTKERNDNTRRTLLDKAENAAIKAGMHDPSDVGKFLDLSELKISDDGKVKGLDEAIASLKESKAFLFKADGTTETDDEKRKRAGASPSGGGGKNGGAEVDWSNSSTDVKAKLREMGVAV